MRTASGSSPHAVTSSTAAAGSATTRSAPMISVSRLTAVPVSGTSRPTRKPPASPVSGDRLVTVDPARPSVLDTTVRAAAGIGEHYLTRGDRVSTVEFGPRTRHLRAATGHRQYLSMLEWLLDVRVVPAGVAPESRLLGPRVLPPS